jgi:serine/threonine-protein kinase
VIDRVFGGRYRITEKIGIGGMAEVFKATDETLGRTVAVKVMLPHFASDPTFAARFKQEAQAAANLQSPYIVNIYDWGHDEQDGTYYIVMEFVRGTDLKTAIEQRGAINQRKVAEIGSQVCSALNVAHGYDIIHRDIKPQNIMIQPDGNAKVMDFGIAHANNANMTQTGSVLGTAYYVSPEQAQGKTLTSASDIYSLGVVLYEAATGRVPFDGPDAVSIAVKQVNEQPVPPRTINRDIDPALETIILKAMQKQTAPRYQTAEQMRQELNNYLGGKPINSGIDSEARTRVINAPAVITPAEGTAVMPALATPGTITRAGGSSSGNGDNQKGKKTALIVTLVILLVLAIAGLAVFLAFCSNSQAADVTVPKVVGLTQADATKQLEDAGLKLGDIKQESSETVEAGKIISQDPAAATKVADGSKVNIVVSKGTGKVAVPDLRNMAPADAEKALDALGLKYGVGTSRPDGDIEAGKICGQDPASGTQVAEGSKITYDISTGPDTAGVPNVIGMSKANAEAALAASGFRVSYNEDVFSSAAAGSVVDQSKTGQATKGDTITLTLSKGPEPTPTPTVAVPNIIGMDVNAASNALNNVGLTLNYTGDGSGKVSTQNPAAGKTVDKGSSVKAEFVVPSNG